MDSPCKGSAIIDFLNSDPLKDRTIERLLRRFFLDFMGKNTWLRRYYRGPLYKEFLGNILKQRGELIEFHKLVRSNIESKSILFYESTNSLVPRMAARIEKFGRSRPKDFYVMKDVMRPFLIIDLGYLTNDRYLRRLNICLCCNKVYVAKTLRTQRFCSDTCRFKHYNTKRAISGRHKAYMRLWRKKKRQTDHVNTQIF